MRGQRGNSLIETTWALLLCVILLLAAVTFIANSMRSTHHNKDKAFAVQKSIAILEELKGLVERKSGGNINLLDGYDDGANLNPILTTQTGITDPAAVASGNLQTDGDWRYLRQVSVQKIPSLQTNDIRMVTVRVYANEVKSNNQTLLSEVAGVIRTIADQYPPTQVYDVYCIATAQVPGWWVYMANLIPFVQNAINDLQARNPGLEFRTHWIRKLAYGRDQEYTPYVNNASDSNADVNWVYWYPGSMPSGSAVNYYYVPTQFKARVSIDGVLTNGYDATTNPVPYALADQYNNAMRYPDELKVHQQRVAAGLETASEPTLRLLLDDMVLNPQNYTNAILINLHGELLPFPPVRNYSDPAKDPSALPNVRVVTHPEYLRTDPSVSSHVKLRVYSYLFDPTGSPAPDKLDRPISVVVRGIDATNAVVKSISGGIDANADGTIDAYSLANASTTMSMTSMYYSTTASTDADGTLVTVFKLYNSPLKTVSVSCGTGLIQGLDTGRRLYVTDYIPSVLPPPGTPTDPFTRGLADCASASTRNTARWIIDIPDTDLVQNTMYTYETRIGDVDPTNTAAFSGSLVPTWNTPTNLSRTYTWYGTDQWAWGDGTSAHPPHVPITEQFQFLGDPRHSPYKDQKNAYNATTNPIGGGYNRYFTDMSGYTGTSNWPGWSVANGWDGGGGPMEIDVNRMYQSLRTALLRTNALWTTMTGFSYFYMGLGNEIGYDSANGFSDDGISVNTKPFTGATGSTRLEQAITSSGGGGVKMIRENVGTNPWWGMYWLGELCPDSLYATWKTSGNLPTGSGTGKFVRTLRGNITYRVQAGTTFFNSVRRTADQGSAALFQVGTASSTFHHVYRDTQTGALQSAGSEIASNYHFPIPSTASISRPFNTNVNSGSPPDFLNSMYYPGTLSASAQATYYNHQDSSYQGSQLLALRGTTYANDQAYIVVNGLDRTVQNGSAFIGRWSFLTLIHSFLVGGLSANNAIQQVPRARITAPNDMTDLSDPSSIEVRWHVDWKRWDGNKYTTAYSDSFADAGSLSYAVLYSADSGHTWQYAQDGAAATPGVRPDGSHLVTPTFDSGTGDWVYSWGVPSSDYPSGSYILMVETYRDGKTLHYAYHKQKIYIKR